MAVLKTLASIIVAAYCLAIVLLYLLQTRLIFYPGILGGNFRFDSGTGGREVEIVTEDDERLTALLYRGTRPEVILYFHGNAGDLSGWQYVAEDFTVLGFNFLIIDYRGYGKSSGTITEAGLYRDGTAAYRYLIDGGFSPDQILVYGRSIGSGVAVEVASRYPCKGLILESPFSSLGRLANEKLPFFFPSLYLRYQFDNLKKINEVRSPVIFLHGSADSLIPASHSSKLFNHFQGKKKMIVVEGGAHNDLHTFTQYSDFVREVLPVFF